MNFSFRVISTDGLARLGRLATPHGVIDTPAFIPVGTQATVKSLTPQDLKSIDTQIVLANTYHLYLQPGPDAIHKLGGLHRFMNWDGPLMTDSGGFQVFSLGWALEHDVGKLVSLFADDSREEIAARQKMEKSQKSLIPRKKLCLVDDDKATFLSHLDGSLHVWTPEKSVEIQTKLGADLILALDECTSPLHDREYTEISMRRSHAWEERSLIAYQKSQQTSAKISKHRITDKSERVGSGLSDFICNPISADPADHQPTFSGEQALYGIVQGGPFRDLRIQSSKFVADHNFFGTAVGGALVNKSKMLEILDWTAPILPPDRPNHLLGIGTIDDILNSVEQGIDTFDCAHPTRIARRGDLLILPQDGGNLKNRWILNITAGEFAADSAPISQTCQCQLCLNGYSRGYLKHLFWAKELLAFRLASIHNLAVMNRLMEDIRDGIVIKRLNKIKQYWFRK